MSHIICEDDGTVIGTFVDLASAQTEANSLATTYASGDPELSVNNTSTYYVCVRTKSYPKTINGITVTTIRQSIDKSWMITTLSAP